MGAPSPSEDRNDEGKLCCWVCWCLSRRESDKLRMEDPSSCHRLAAHFVDRKGS